MKPELSGDEKALLYQMANARRREMLWYDVSIIAPTIGMAIYGLLSGNLAVGLIGIGLYVALRVRATFHQERAAVILQGAIQKLMDRYESDDGTHPKSEQGVAGNPDHSQVRGQDHQD